MLILVSKNCAVGVHTAQSNPKKKIIDSTAGPHLMYFDQAGSEDSAPKDLKL